MPSKKINPASSFDVAQMKIFDDTHEKAEDQFNDFCAENKLKIDDIKIVHRERRQGENGARYTYLIILYQIKNPVK